MVIHNNTDTILTIDKNKIQPGETYDTYEMAFNTVNVFSSIGAIEITTEYSKRSFDCYGNLIAEELEDRDDQGLRHINIRRKKI